MHYYKSTELADLYGVSRRTVTNWVKQVQDGKLDLELEINNGEHYIIKSRHNQSQLDKIVGERQKYLNNRSLKTLSPEQKFYELYSEQQIYDIIQTLNLHKELPLQYSYFLDEGAELWDTFRSRLGGRFDAVELVESSRSYLDRVLEKFDKVNIVDVGVGNGLGAKDIITHLKSQGKLNKYIGIDISQAMLNVAERNINSWFDGHVTCEMYIKDISHQLFGDVITEPVNPSTQRQEIVNLVLLFGGSISNFKDPDDVMRNISKSMGSQDIFMSHFKIGTQAVKNRLSFINNYQAQCAKVLELMGIDRSLYTSEIGFDDETPMRYGAIRLNRTIKINFQLPKGTWVVDLKKDDSILTYRARFNEPFDTPRTLFYKNGFNPLLTTRTLDNTGMLVLATLDSKNIHH